MAKIHDVGFDHPDLYSKHVLVHPSTFDIRILDWQRSRRYRRVTDRVRWRDLAALNATVAGDLATTLDRHIALRAYLRRVGAPKIKSSSRAIVRFTNELRRRRPRLEEYLRPHTIGDSQQLMWLDGEALCLTPDFYASFKGKLPSWLSKWSCRGATRKRSSTLEERPRTS